MKWFCKNVPVSVCKECGAHYDPVVGYESRWGDLCPTHRKPVMELDLRREAVVSWASQCWEKLEPMYLEERKELEKRAQILDQFVASPQINQHNGLGLGLGLGIGDILRARR